MVSTRDSAASTPDSLASTHDSLMGGRCFAMPRGDRETSTSCLVTPDQCIETAARASALDDLDLECAADSNVVRNRRSEAATLGHVPTVRDLET